MVKKECFNRWYGLTPYYLALTISRLPLQIFFNVIFLTCVYFLAGLPLEPWRFVLFALVGVIVSAVAEGLGLAIGATFSVTVRIIFSLKTLKIEFFSLFYFRTAAQSVQPSWRLSSALPFTVLTLPPTFQH